ncbi:MAG: type II secretion system F family protein, partial [Gammaproteobacteria bacterium]|nr:type II secretion system F family protein [Gammaproteobacteria bacterium]
IDIHLHVGSGRLQTGLKELLKPNVETADLIQFSRQMYSMLRAGIPIFRAVKALAATTANATLKMTLERVGETLESGRTLSEALGQHPKIFTVFYISMVRVGETSGQMEHAFQQLAFYLDREKQTRKKIKAALRYPVFVISAIFVALGIISLFVIPAFADMFKSFGAELPLPTRILMAISDFMINYWAIILAAIVLSVIGLRSWINTEDGCYRWDKVMLRVPLTGPVIYKALLARFSHLFSMSLGAGVPLNTSLTVVSHALNNRFLEERILGMRSGIEQGNALSMVAASSGIFDPLVMQMLAVGEESGTVNELLGEIAEYYDREVEYSTERLSASIEPILTMIIGVLVLVMAMGVFLPMWDLASAALH